MHRQELDSVSNVEHHHHDAFPDDIELQLDHTSSDDMVDHDRVRMEEEGWRRSCNRTSIYEHDWA